MRTQAGLHIDPGALAAGPGERELEVVVPYTEWALADATLQRAAVLAAGLNVRVRLVAVHSVPYAASFGCPAAVHAHLVEQLVDLASRCQVHQLLDRKSTRLNSSHSLTSRMPSSA